MTDKRFTQKRSCYTVNDLQKWIDHLSEDEKELPIVVSEKVFPKPEEILEPQDIGHFLSLHFDGFVIVAKKNFKSEHKEDDWEKL